MKTDWNLIRAMMNAAIDTCEQIEEMGYSEEQRDKVVDVGGRAVSVYEFMVSAWTYPESVRYEVIRRRHEQGIDLPYVPEAARLLTAMAQVGAELVGAAEVAPADASVRAMVAWYGEHAIPNLKRALAPES